MYMNNVLCENNDFSLVSIVCLSQQLVEVSSYPYLKVFSKKDGFNFIFQHSFCGFYLCLNVQFLASISTCSNGCEPGRSCFVHASDPRSVHLILRLQQIFFPMVDGYFLNGVAKTVSKLHCSVVIFIWYNFMLKKSHYCGKIDYKNTIDNFVSH